MPFTRLFASIRPVGLAGLWLLLMWAGLSAGGAPVQWTPAGSGNGHWYELIASDTSVTWTNARDAAMAMGGHLATITSAGEEAFITNTLLPMVPSGPVQFNAWGWWLGAQRTVPGTIWQWETGEPFVYTAWAPNQPDGPTNPVAWLGLFSYDAGPSNFGRWDDVVSGYDWLFHGFIVEYDGSAPFANTQPATGITLTNANLNGMATPNGLTTAAWFEWGADTTYGQTTSPMLIGNSSAVVRVSTNLCCGNLVPHQIYHYRLVVSNALGMARGGDASFITGGRLVAWGDNSFGQTNIPPGLSNVVAVAGGGYHGLALRADGSVATWGDKNNSQGLTNVPAGLSNVIAVAAGDAHSLALRTDGTIVGWGNYYYGQTNVPPGLTNAIAIAAGAYHSIALRRDGTVVAWGYYYDGETNVPSGLSNVVAVAAGWYHSVALRDDGSVIAWGSGANGETNVPVGLSNVVAIAAGSAHTVALRSDGSLVAWGANDYGQTNIPSGLSNVTAVVAGSTHNLGLLNNGSATAWGYYSSGTATGPALVPAWLAKASGLAAGEEFSIALGQDTPPQAVSQTSVGTANADLLIYLRATDPNGDGLTFRISTVPAPGTLYQYNNGAHGALITAPNTTVTDAGGRVIFVPGTNGLGNPYASFTFVANDGELDSLPATVAITILGLPYATTQPASSITLTSAVFNGMVTPNNSAAPVAWYEWGTTTGYGQRTGPVTTGAGGAVLRVSSQVSNLAPHQVYHYRLVVSNSIATVRGADQPLVTGRKVTAWGEGTNNVYPGNGQALVPAGLSNAVAVAGGGSHSLALRTDGTVTAWGNGFLGQTNVPGGLNNVMGIAAGDAYCLALRNDGRVFVWGSNGNGATNVPGNLTNAVAIAAGSPHAMALRRDGTVAVWGDQYNFYGVTSVPAGLSNVVAVAAGYGHCLALRDDGTVVAWGDDNNGQTNVPSGLSNVVAIAAGWFHSLAVRSDGVALAWGAGTNATFYPNFGQSSVPNGLNNAASVAGGDFHSLALRNDGTVLAWGNDPNGETNVPVGLASVVAIAAGGAHSLALGGDLPPSVAPQIGSGPVNKDVLIMLSGTDLNGDSLSLRIGTLPGAGALYQYGTGGSRGAPIGSPNTVITDSLGRVIFAPATNGFGKPYTTFTYLANDGELDSAAATVTIYIIGDAMAATQPPAPVSTTNAILNGMATPGGLPSSAWFEWGTTTAYGQLSAQTNTGAGVVVVRVSLSITNLLPHQDYHCRLVVSNASGVARGLDQPFVSGGKLVAWGYNYANGSYLGQATLPPGVSNIVSAAAGYAHSLALRADGTVFAWGDTNYGQTSVPTGLSNVMAVAAGSYHNLALLKNGTVMAWGGFNSALTNVPAGLSNVVAVSAGGAQSVALRKDGSVVIWGDPVNSSGQTNFPAGLSNIVAIASGDTHNLALRNDGTVLAWGSSYYWSSDGATNVPSGLSNVVAIAAHGNHSLALRADGGLVPWGDLYSSVLSIPGSVTNVAAIATGGDCSLALLTNGTVFAWGLGNVGQTNVPAGVTNIVALAAGYQHCLALGSDMPPLTRSQTVYGAANADLVITLPATDLNADPLHLRIVALPATGTLYQYNGGVRGPAITITNTTLTDLGGRVIFTAAPNAFGHPYATFSFVANDGEADSLPGVMTVEMGVPFAASQPVSRTWAGTIFTWLNGMATPNGLPTVAWFEWGTNTSYGQVTGQLVVGNGAEVVPVSVSLASLLPGQGYHCRLVVSNAVGVVRGIDQPFTTGQRALAWGDDLYNQTEASGYYPNAVAVAGGRNHSLALLNDGEVVSWGVDQYCGNYPYTCDAYCGQTVVPSGVANVHAIAAGGCFSAVVRNDTTAFVWGGGNATNVPAGLTGLLAISAGGDHCLALRNDGTVVAWGDNTFGQTNVPAGLSNVVAVAAGESHSLALRNDGTVFAWGDNTLGQTNIPPSLGRLAGIAAGGAQCLGFDSAGSVFVWGGASQADVPAGLSNVVAVSAGDALGLALSSDGTVTAWGDYPDPNYLYYTIPFYSPARLYGASAVAAGANHGLAIGSDNDYFDSRVSISGTNINFTTSNSGATRETDEPDYFGTNPPPASTVWFTWMAPSAGGVEVTARGGDSSPSLSPILAVYTGTTLFWLTNVAFNSTPFNGAGSPLGSRAVFTAVAGRAYQISVDATNQGDMVVNLRLMPPPVNDLFSNAFAIGDTFFETSGSFIGADREPNEPTHGDVSRQQTLWWTWTAPTNLGVTAYPMRLMADGVSFPPGLGVYVGDSLGSLVNQISSQQTSVPGPNVVYTNGMTSVATFKATAGTNYYIALSGHENDTSTVLTNFGNFHFRLNSQALALSLQNLSKATNFDDASVSFRVDALVQNFGSNASNPLQVYALAIGGSSMRGGNSEQLQSTQFVVGTWPATQLVLGSGQSVLVTNITGIIPGPTYPDNQRAQGWGSYARLQEMPLGAANWFTVDEALVSFGIWPTFDGFVGPGGGVIRLDPYYPGDDSFVPFPFVAIHGPSQVRGGTTTNYTGSAMFNNGTYAVFTGTAWRCSPGSFPISTNGVFSPGAVVSNTVVTLTAPYIFKGCTTNVTYGVTVLAPPAPPPSFTGFQLLPNGSIVLTLSNNPGRTNIIEAATNLAPPLTAWVPLATNAPVSGLWNFTDPFRTNFPRRFYRAHGL